MTWSDATMSEFAAIKSSDPTPEEGPSPPSPWPSRCTVVDGGGIDPLLNAGPMRMTMQRRRKRRQTRSCLERLNLRFDARP